ncbi:multidrug resistance protein MATE family protein [Dioscorea alata]|uniref:Multidrug resistance protein MATE family protein n=1 Tax=Dioscorea alata TaxID=55571 RepID=A0ACB7V205_DIOAL|nr:multidrug resistance protein MATE family protein [Dioscorea alata]
MGSEIKEKLLEIRNGEEEGEEEKGLWRRVKEENKKLWVVAGPAIFARFSIFGVSVITQAFIGHIGSIELAAFALTSTVLLRFANGILLGMASALETLCGQAFGAGQRHMLGIYLQRSWVVLLACAIVLLPLFIFTAPILRLLGQENSIASMAGTISLWFIPIIFSYVFYFTFQMYLQSQSKNIIIAYYAAFSLGVHILLSWFLVSKLSFGLPGAMSTLIVAIWIPNIGLFVYVACGGCPETWTGFSLSAFRSLWPVVRLSLSSGAMICLELWYNTILILLTGHMKDAEVAIDALSICLNINGWELMISLGFLSASGVRVANELGAGSAKRAKFSIVVVVITSLLIGAILFVMFLLFRGNIAYFFTESPEVAAAVADLSPLLAFSILLNSIQPVLSGVAVGAGWQSVVAYVNVASYYLIGIPLGVVLGYLIGYQVKGIWIGMLIGTAIQTFVLIWITWRTDWDKQVMLAQTRVNKWLLPSSKESNIVKEENV